MSQPIEDSKIAWLRSRCRAMSQARNEAGRQGIAEEWWTATPFRNPFIAADVEQFIDDLNREWARGQR